MPQELIALVGGPMDHQLHSVNDSQEPYIRYRLHDLDEHSFAMAVYERAGIGPDGVQEYVYTEDVVMFTDSLAAAGEDVWCLQQFPDGYKGFAADVGAHDGVTLNNTLLLEQRGWTVLCVEPQPNLRRSLEKERGLIESCACGSADLEDQDFHVHLTAPQSLSALKPTKSLPKWGLKSDSQWGVIQVPVRRLDGLLRKHRFPKLDVLSVDVEGNELDVLAGIDLTEWAPKCVILESWAHIGPVVPYMAERGYRYVLRRDPNDFFLRNE